MTNIFIAYPNDPAIVGATIERLPPMAKSSLKQITISTWKRDDLSGQPVIQPVLEAIRSADIVVGDVTVPNFNVTYELGFALGIGKRVLPVRSRAVARPPEYNRLGLYDTLILSDYSNAEDLFGIIAAAQAGKRMATSYPFDPLPLYIVLPEVKIDDVNGLESRARRAGLKARIFDPEEETRLSAVEAVKAVSTSYGVVAPLISPRLRDANLHNVRCAFVAGIGHALERRVLILQKEDWDTPLDVRDSVYRYNSEDNLGEIFANFAEKVHELRYSPPVGSRRAKSRLVNLNMGDPSAENEESQLKAYFLERAEYKQVVDGRANIVVGRKGSGKTAVFAQTRDQMRQNRSSIVVDISPRSHQLKRMKDFVLVWLSSGSKDYLLSAFWEYVLLIEIATKILEKDKDVHKRNHDLFEPYQRLLKFYKEDPASSGIDFSDRLAILIDRVANGLSVSRGAPEAYVLTHDILTSILYQTTLAELKREIETYSRFKSGIHVLFDNVDKGWNADGLEPSDIIIVRTLIDAGRKLQNDFRRRNVDFNCVVFLRNDIYELMVSATPDRGKEVPVLVDWSQADLLSQMVRRRLLFNSDNKSASVDELWFEICVPLIQGEKSLNMLIRHSMMRPRYLLRLISFCVGNAINFDKDRIDEDDIRSGLNAYSTYIISEIDLEIRDVLPSQGEVLYIFLGEPRRLSKQSVLDLLGNRIGNSQTREEVFNLLLWHGVLGLVREQSDATFIYDVNYDIKRLRGLMDKVLNGNPMLEVNPGFWSGLELV